MRSITELAESFRLGVHTPADVTEVCLQRIRERNDAIRAWVLVDEEGARQRAEEATLRWRSGSPHSMLDGVPFAVKDIVDVAGWPTRAGSPLRDSHLAKSDAVIIQQLTAAGLNPLGKTVTTQFACFDPSETRNPRDMQRTPGGSSSGSAAAVADGMVPLALATQTGGSITRPASYCGIAGLKPTFARVSLEGVVPVSSHLDHMGWVAANASDLALVWQVVSKESSEPWRRSPRLLDITSSMPGCDAQVSSVTAQALSQLEAAGAEVVQFAPPWRMEELLLLHRQLMAVEAHAVHESAFSARPSNFLPKISELIQAGAEVSEDEHQRCINAQSAMRSDLQEWLNSCQADAVVTPSTSTTAPFGLESTGDPSFNSPWSFTGSPTVTLPCGVAADGGWCGLQLVGRVNADAEILEVARWCESHLLSRS